MTTQGLIKNFDLYKTGYFSSGLKTINLGLGMYVSWQNTYIHKTLDPISIIKDKTKQNMVVHACNSNIQEVEAGKTGIQGHPQLLSEFETSLRYRRPCVSLPAKGNINAMILYMGLTFNKSGNRVGLLWINPTTP